MARGPEVPGSESLDDSATARPWLLRSLGKMEMVSCGVFAACAAGRWQEGSGLKRIADVWAHLAAQRQGCIEYWLDTVAASSAATQKRQARAPVLRPSRRSQQVLAPAAPVQQGALPGRSACRGTRCVFARALQPSPIPLRGLAGA